MTQRIATGRRTADPETSWTTVVGTIRKGMRVIAPDGSCLGTVRGLENGEILLEPTGNSQETEFVALTQVDGVDEESVLLSGRGDATFGLGGEP